MESRIQLLTRRAFIATTTALAPTLIACQRDKSETVTEPLGDGIDVTTQSVRIDLAKVPALAAVGASLVVPSAHVMVIRIDATTFRALSNVCTHAGCGIYQYTNERLRCQCHGSEFDNRGKNLVGPAQDPLREFPVAMNDGVLVINLV